MFDCWPLQNWYSMLTQSSPGLNWLYMVWDAVKGWNVCECTLYCVSRLLTVLKPVLADCHCRQGVVVCCFMLHLLSHVYMYGVEPLCLSYLPYFSIFDSIRFDLIWRLISHGVAFSLKATFQINYTVQQTQISKLTVVLKLARIKLMAFFTSCLWRWQGVLRNISSSRIWTWAKSLLALLSVLPATSTPHIRITFWFMASIVNISYSFVWYQIHMSKFILCYRISSFFSRNLRTL